MAKKLALMITIALFVGAGSLAHAAVNPIAACKEKKAKATGKKAADLLKAFGKNEKKPNPAKLAVDISKAQSKFTKAFTKAEKTGGASCPTSGDASAIEAKVDALVTDVVGDIAPPTTTTTPSSSTTTTTTCDCCGFTQLSFETGIGSGTCGTTANFRCSGGHANFVNHACSTNPECNKGPCLAGIFCQQDTSITCTVDADCVGTCAQIGGFLNLDCGGVYTGGGNNGTPLPLPVPDQGLSFTNITGCDSGTGVLTLGPTTPADLSGVVAIPKRSCTQGRTCSTAGTPCVLDGDCPFTETCDDNCLFGPPLPIPNSNTTPWSFCAIQVVAQDADGTAQCDGSAINLSLPLRWVLPLTGDSLSSVTGPIDVPGIQPCALCSAQCVGGANADQPCEDNSDCDSNTCDGAPNCIGSIDHGNPCTPATSKLSDAFPTSHDCRVNPSQDITGNIGGLSISLSLTTGSQTMQGVDQPAGIRNFCGFCRDVEVEGSGCFDGNPDPGNVRGCPDSAAIPDCLPQSGTTSGCGNAIECTDDTDCTPPYESCVQRSPGAFSDGSATVISVTGSPAGVCLDDGAEHSSTLVSAFCIPPTFDATIDSSWDLPGPGAEMRQGVVQLK
jgi:hypothetical protein